MKQRLLLAVVILAFHAVTARAADVNFSATLSSYGPNAYIDLVIPDCGQDAQGRPNIPLTATRLLIFPQVLATASDGTVSATVTPNSGVTCGNVTGSSHYRVEVRRRAGAYPNPATDPLLSANVFTIGPGDFTLSSAVPAVSPGSPPAAIDYTGYVITRPVRALLYAAFPTSCTAHKDLLLRLDPAVAGQVLYVCNATGTGWDLVGGGSSQALFTFAVNGASLTSGSTFSVNGASVASGTTFSINGAAL